MHPLLGDRRRLLVYLFVWQLLGLLLQPAALFLQRLERVLVEIEAAALQRGDDGREVLSEEGNVQHLVIGSPPSRG